MFSDNSLTEEKKHKKHAELVDNINILVDDALAKNKDSFSDAKVEKKRFSNEFLKHGVNKNSSRIVKNKLPVRKILAIVLSLILILVLIPASLPFLYGDPDSDVSISIYPENVHNDDSMFINVTIPSYYHIRSVAADVSSIETLDLSLIDNSTDQQLWQVVWLAHDVEVGEHIVKITAIDVENVTYSAETRWSVLSDISYNSNFSGLTNESDDNSDDQSSEPDKNETVPPDIYDVNKTTNETEIIKLLNISISSDKESYLINETVILQGNVIYNNSYVNTSTNLSIISPYEILSSKLNVSNGLFNYSFNPLMAGSYIVNSTVFYGNVSTFAELGFVVNELSNISTNKTEELPEEEPGKYNDTELGPDFTFWESKQKGNGRIGSVKMDYDKAWKYMLKQTEWSLQAFVNGSWQNVDGLKIKYNKISDNLRKFSLEFAAPLNPKADYRLVLNVDIPVVDYDFDEGNNKFSISYVSYGNPWIFEYDYSDIARLPNLVFDHDVNDDGRFQFNIQMNNISYGANIFLDPTYGFIGDSITSSFEWDGIQGEEADAIRLSTSEYYLIAASGPGDDGYLYTIRVWNSNGTIRQSVVDSWEYGPTDGNYPSLCLASTTGGATSFRIYALIFKNTTLGASVIKTVKVWNSNGTIYRTPIDTQAVSTFLGNYHDFIHVTGNYYAFVGQNNATKRGIIKTCYITQAGDIGASINSSIEFDTSKCYYPKIILVDTNTVAITYSGPDQDGYLKTYNISSTGTITATAADSWEYDTTYGNYSFIQNISGDYYAIAYRDTDGDGQIKTCVIKTDGDITASWVDTLEFDPADCMYPYICEIEVGVIYSIAYKGVSGDGFIKTVNISRTGIISDEILDFYEFDTDDCQWYPNTIHVSGDYYLIVYTGYNSLGGAAGTDDGWSKTIAIESNTAAIYYFNGYDSKGEKWTTNPQNMVDGNNGTFASETVDRTVELLNSNTCDGTNLGTISKVEIRAYGYYAGTAPSIKLRPIFSLGDGTNHPFYCALSPGNWSKWFDITTDTNAPATWTWSEVNRLTCDVETAISGLASLYCSKVEICVTYTNNAPSAAYASGADSVQYGGKQYSFTTNHTDVDGVGQIEYAYAAVGDANDDIQFRCDPNSGASPTVTVTYGSSYLVGGTAIASRSSITNGWQITWTYTIDWDWDHDDSAVVDYWAYTTDDPGLNSGWDQEDLNYNYENDLIIYSITQYTLNNSAYSQDGDTALGENEWFRGGVQVKSSGVVTYEGTTNEYPPTTAVDVQLWANGANLGASFQDETLGSNGEFETPYNTTTSALGVDSDFDFNVSLVDFTSGASQGSGQTTTLRNSRRDNGLPTSSVDAISPYWKSTSPITIAGTASDASGSGLKNVTLWYSYRATNASGWGGWVSSGLVDTNPWVSISWSFTPSNGTGHYEFYSKAVDNVSNIEIFLGEPPPADANCGYDNVAPGSSVDAITPYWKKAAATITATATDATSGVKNVTLYYRFSSNNASWGGNVSGGVDTASPWSWSFSFSNGSGYYQFYSIAKDNATNTESAPGSADRKCGYDNVAPTSSVNTIIPYINTTGIVNLAATASDALSGVKNVTLWYRNSTNNVTWSGWVQNATDSSSPWSWTFTFPNGTGYYQFYSRAYDNAGNQEAAPGTNDAKCQYNPGSASFNITPWTLSLGNVWINGSSQTTSYYFNLTNDGGVPINVQIKGDNATNSTTGFRWNLTATPGVNNFNLSYKRNGDTVWKAINCTYDAFAANLLIGAYKTFDLKMIWATESSGHDPMSFDITIKCVMA